jgi:predicted DsbA family dithiol-disulfide isomerase
MAEAAGLPYRPGPVVSNSMLSLQLAEFARDAGDLERLHPLMFRAYWEHGRDIGNLEVLKEVAGEAGLDVDGATAALRERRYEARIRGSTEAAVNVGVDGVPAWLVEERLLIPGAQPHEVFDRLLAQIGFEPVEGGSSEQTG